MAKFSIAFMIICVVALVAICQAAWREVLDLDEYAPARAPVLSDDDMIMLKTLRFYRDQKMMMQDPRKKKRKNKGKKNKKCVDDHESCSKYKDDCNAEGFADYMSENCRLTCGLCKKDDEYAPAPSPVLFDDDMIMQDPRKRKSKKKGKKNNACKDSEGFEDGFCANKKAELKKTMDLSDDCSENPAFQGLCKATCGQCKPVITETATDFLLD